MARTIGSVDLLAEHRMPEMTGVGFLERSRQLYPKARRVLLTSYADTGWQ
jgi:thioredoxin reductase (NADPH)